MGKRGRRRSTGATGPLASSTNTTIPTTIYTDADGGELELRGSLTPKARTEYAAVLAGGIEREDAWQRAAELLFERLAVSWTVSGVRTDKQRELLGRYRMASGDERRFVRESLRAHVAENFPELKAP
ncbi:MAG: hypothetical protein FWD04_12325 [Conexibacteraceae bacterium]|nr:hypothetical protein [Conexibacteraceae bacterium]